MDISYSDNITVSNKRISMNTNRTVFFQYFLFNSMILIPALSCLLKNSNNRNLYIFGYFLISSVLIMTHKRYLNTPIDSAPFKGIPHIHGITKKTFDDLKSQYRQSELNVQLGLTLLAESNEGVASCMYGDDPYVVIFSFEAFNQLVSRRYFMPITPFTSMKMLPMKTVEEKKASNCKYKQFMQSIRPTLIHSDPLFKRLSGIPEKIYHNLLTHVAQSQSLNETITSINLRLLCSLPGMLDLNLNSISNTDLVLFKKRSEHAQKFLGVGPNAYTDKDRELKSWVVSFMNKLIKDNFAQLSQLKPNSNLIQLAFNNRGQLFPESIDAFNEFARSNTPLYEKIMLDLVGQAGPGTFSRSVSDLLAGMIYCIEKYPAIKKLVLDELSSVDFKEFDFSENGIDNKLPNLTLLVLEFHRYLSTNNFITGVITEPYITKYKQEKLRIPVGTRFVLETAKCTRNSTLYKNPNQIDINNVRSVKNTDTTYKFLLSNSHGPWGVFGRRPCPARVLITYAHILTIASIYKYYEVAISDLHKFPLLVSGDDIHKILNVAISFTRLS